MNVLLLVHNHKAKQGPLLNRIDIRVEAPHVNYDKLASERQGEPSRAMRERFRHTQVLTNADMELAAVRRHCQLDGTGQRLM
jgi:magnesium chelatase family protein